MRVIRYTGRYIAIIFLLLSLMPMLALADGPKGEWAHNADDTVLDAAGSADGSLIAIGARDNVLSVYDASSELLWEHTADDSVSGVDVSEDGAYIATASADRHVRLFDARGELLWAYRSKFPLSDVAISADGEYVSASSVEGRNLVFLNRAGDLLWDKNLVAPVESTDIYGSGEKTRPLAGTRDSRIYILNVTGDELLRIQLDSEVAALAVSRSGARIAVALRDGTVAMLNGGNGTVLWEYATRREKSSDRALSVGMDDQATLVLAGVTYGKVFFFDEDGNLTQERKRQEDVDCVYVSRDGQTIVRTGHPAPLVQVSLQCQDALANG